MNKSSLFRIFDYIVYSGYDLLNYEHDIAYKGDSIDQK